MWKLFLFGEKEYLVSETGEIISKASGKLLKPRLNVDGYLYVTLGSSKSKNRKQSRTACPVHRIVAQLYVPNPNPDIYVEVNHKDFNRANPNAENLEWSTHAENIQYSIKNKRMYVQNNDCSGAKNFNAKLTEEQVKEIRALSQQGWTTYAIAKKYSRGWTTIKHIIDKDTWKNI